MSRRVSCIPSSDGAFVAAARNALERISPLANPDRIASLVQGALEGVYPFVEVHRQHILARLPDDDVWYAYRDGASGREAERPEA